MSETEWERHLTELLKIAAGEPSRAVTTDMVRRRVARQRLTAALATATAMVLLGGAGAAVAAVSDRGAPANMANSAPGVPRFYLQLSYGSTHSARWIVRSRTTGAVTATVRCPSPALPSPFWPIAAASRGIFFIGCPRGTQAAVTESRIYRFRLTNAGRIRGYLLVRGGMLTALRADGIAATPDGSEIAITVIPGTAPVGSRFRNDILVINTRTGRRALWRASPDKPGTIRYLVGEMSLTANGHELAFLTQPQCVRKPGGPRCHVTGGEEVRALSPAARGGQVSGSRLLVRQSSVMRLSVGYINAAVISPDGSAVILAEAGWPFRYISVARISASSGKQVGVVYRVRTGNGFRWGTFAADASVRYFILDAGPVRGPMPNGWIYHRRLIKLKPYDGTNVFQEVW
jgi:hypothetical protein